MSELSEEDEKISAIKDNLDAAKAVIGPDRVACHFCQDGIYEDCFWKQYEDDLVGVGQNIERYFDDRATNKRIRYEVYKHYRTYIDPWHTRTALPTCVEIQVKMRWPSNTCDGDRTFSGYKDPFSTK
jgi:hypothetical protein